MAEGELFRDLMIENHQYVKAFSDNPEFQKLLVAMFVMANDEAARLGCNLEDQEVENPTMSADGKYISFGFIKREEAKKSGLLGPNGEELMSMGG